MSADVPAARLVLTWSRIRWHISHPGSAYYTLCMSQVSTARRLDSPIYSDVCKRCQRAYDREVPDVR